tara:strand:- start:455 stop:838 length:384 start_codon:yes stop_codon:yes gene_type:complete
VKTKTKNLKIYCIYNANGTLFGELSYLFKKAFLGFKCPMCDITHRTLIKKKHWIKKIHSFQYNLEAVHLNEQPSEIKKFTNQISPCVIAIYENSFKLLLDSKELSLIHGDVNLFFKKLEQKINTLLS